MTKRRVVIGVLVAAALVLSLGRWASEQYTDSLWFAALGADSVWRARFLNGMAVRIGSFLAASAFAFVNLYAVRQSVVSLVLPRRIANIEIGEEVPGRYLLLATMALSAAIGAALSLSGDVWSTALLARTLRCVPMHWTRSRTSRAARRHSPRRPRAALRHSRRRLVATVDRRAR